MPNDKPDVTQERLAAANRRGFRLPGEPSAFWGKVSSGEIIRRLRKAEKTPSADTVEIPAGASIDQILSLLHKGNSKKATVEEALRSVVQLHRQRQAGAELAGIGWEGDLDAMREGRGA